MNEKDDLMDDEELLRQLASTARDLEGKEPGHFDGRWDELAAGSLSAAEQEELRREDPEAFEAFRPLGSDFQGAVVARIRSQASPSELATPIPFPRRRRRVLPWVAAAAVIAAMFTLLWPGGEPQPLATYSLALTGGVEEFRGPRDPGQPPGGESQRFAPGNVVHWILTPAAATGPVEARAFVSHGEDVRPWPAPIETAPSGAVSVSATLDGTLSLPPGDSTLMAVIGRPGSLPREGRLRRDLARRLSSLAGSPAGCAPLSPRLLLCHVPVSYPAPS